jgi:hypothetical protein
MVFTAFPVGLRSGVGSRARSKGKQAKLVIGWQAHSRAQSLGVCHAFDLGSFVKDTGPAERSEWSG